jgi:hypothetical protein
MASDLNDNPSRKSFSNHTSDRGPLPTPWKTAAMVLLDGRLWAVLLYGAAMAAALVFLIQESSVSE